MRQRYILQAFAEKCSQQSDSNRARTFALEAIEGGGTTAF